MAFFGGGLRFRQFFGLRIGVSGVRLWFIEREVCSVRPRTLNFLGFYVFSFLQPSFFFFLLFRTEWTLQLSLLVGSVRGHLRVFSQLFPFVSVLFPLFALLLFRVTKCEVREILLFFSSLKNEVFFLFCALIPGLWWRLISWI